MSGEVYELVDTLPRGPARVAAWNAYALQTYGDKLTAACYAADTADVGRRAYSLAEEWLQRARQPAAGPGDARPALPDALPHWHTPIRSHAQLVGMREALEALRTYVAFDLQSSPADDASTAI